MSKIGWGVVGNISWVAVLLIGCSVSPKPKAAQSLRCPEAQLQVEGKTAYSDLVTGCGKSDVIVLDKGGNYTSVRERAAFELSCADSELNVVAIEPSLYGVTGCGKKITYKFIYDVGLVADTASGK